MENIIVIGGSITGLSAALLLSRRGHQVTLVETDAGEPPADVDDIMRNWRRPGVPQGTSILILAPLGRNLLKKHLPDVLSRAIAAGAREVYANPGDRAADENMDPDDEEVVYLACRRRVLESVLRKTILVESKLEFRSGCRVKELITRSSDIPGVPRVVGVRTHDGETLMAEVVVDASGRRSQIPGWFAKANARPFFEQSEDCGLVYYSSYFRRRTGQSVLPLIRPFGSIGNLSFMSYALLLSDNNTFGVILAIPTWDSDLRMLSQHDAFLNAVKCVPALAPHVDLGHAEPISSVIPYGQLQNKVRRFTVDGRPVALGIQVIGDALSHTNPSYAWGMSLGISHAVALAEVLDQAPADPMAQALLFDEKTFGETWGRYEKAVQSDDWRNRCWQGEVADPTDPVAEPGGFMTNEVIPAAAKDAGILRALVREMGLLDPAGSILRNSEFVERARSIYSKQQKEVSEAPRKTLTRENILEAISSRQPGN